MVIFTTVCECVLACWAICLKYAGGQSSFCSSNSRARSTARDTEATCTALSRTLLQHCHHLQSFRIPRLSAHTGSLVAGFRLLKAHEATSDRRHLTECVSMCVTARLTACVSLHASLHVSHCMCVTACLTESHYVRHLICLPMAFQEDV